MFNNMIKMNYSVAVYSIFITYNYQYKFIEFKYIAELRNLLSIFFFMNFSFM